MSDYVYSLTGVKKSKIDTGEIHKRGDTFNNVATTAAAVLAGAAGVVASVSAANQGAAMDAYQRSMQETLDHLDYLGQKAGSTSSAHHKAADAVKQAQNDMQAICNAAARKLAAILVMPPVPQRQTMWAHVVDRARTDLTDKNVQGEADVNAAYSGILPIKQITMSEGETRGSIPQDVVDEYKKLSPQDRMKFYQNLAEQVLEDWPPDERPKVVFYSYADPQPPGTIRPKDDWRRFNGVQTGDTININYDIMAKDDYPTVMSTTVHEIQHAKQSRMRKEYESLGWLKRSLIANGATPDPFKRYGSSIHEVGKRFGTEYQGSDKPGYTHQYVEVDARRAGTEYLDNMIPDEMRALFP